MMTTEYSTMFQERRDSGYASRNVFPEAALSNALIDDSQFWCVEHAIDFSAAFINKSI